MTLESIGKYTRFDDRPGSTHNLVLSLVPPGARVLELGCATGYMSAELRERLDCVVTGVELDPAAAEAARARASRLIVGDAEALALDELLGEERFDVVLFADVLEHLRDPGALLRRVRPWLAEGGTIVASIPNVAHGSVRAALLAGHFRYAPTGLLDETHLRFFTHESVLALFEEAGYVVADWLRRREEIDQTEVAAQSPPLAATLREQLELDPEATTYQFVVRARRVEEAAGLRPVRADLGALQAELDARDAAARALEEKLAEQAEAAGRAEREAGEREAALREQVARLGDTSARLDALSQQVAASTAEQADLRRQLEATRADFFSRGDDLQASLYDLSAAVASLAPAGLLPPDAAATEYRRVTGRVRELVRAALPRDATVVVVSRGDDALLSLYGRRGWHFPRTEDGRWAGEYPASSAGAIAQLEALRALGAQFLLIPKPALWWLDHYAELSRYLDDRYRPVVRGDDAGALYDLRCPLDLVDSSARGRRRLDDLAAVARARLDREPAVLDWSAGLDLALDRTSLAVFSPPRPEADRLPYLDRSVDIVALASDDPDRQAEARRVASLAVLTFADGGGGSGPATMEVTWLPGANDDSAAGPSVSIVIPCHDNVAHTQACLRALRETIPSRVVAEIVVVDDASTDDTPRVLQGWVERDGRVRVVRNARNAGFVDSCNRGAAAATGDVLVFLNNDTVPLAGWLEALTETFRQRPSAGAVGGKLVYPDGRLQEAGGVVFADGSAANFGRGAYDLEAPLFNFVREVDYCSAALLATPRALYERIGGFDTRYRPAYYEDTDYCFAVRAQGRRVYYQPMSAVVHREGATAGTDVSSGVKHHQLLNQATFAAKWAEALAGRPERPTRWDLSTWYDLAVRLGGAAAGDR